MTSIENEKLIDYLVISNKPGRRFTTEKDNRWGGLIEPDPSENSNKTNDGLRVVLFASWDFGYLVLETLKKFENKFPDQLNLAGLVTDNPLNPNAKISLKKRVWNLLDKPFRTIDETLIIESGLSHGIPVYTGEVKVNSFHDIMKKWNPEAIIVCVFGQVIDSFIINYPQYGIYNFHPSDLSGKHGAGPAPYEDLATRHSATGLWSVHHVSEEIDGGVVIGKSPPVNVLNVNGELPENPIVVYHKLSEVLSPLIFFLMKELVRNFKLNRAGCIDSIDFENSIPVEIKDKIMLPVTVDRWTDILSVPDDFLFNPW
jgi:hypothetical protein